jgi:hypothetical protein
LPSIEMQQVWEVIFQSAAKPRKFGTRIMYAPARSALEAKARVEEYLREDNVVIFAVVPHSTTCLVEETRA